MCQTTLMKRFGGGGLGLNIVNVNNIKNILSLFFLFLKGRFTRKWVGISEIVKPCLLSFNVRMIC